MDRARLAVIGCGGHCTVRLMPGIPCIPEIDLAAVCDLKEDLARRNARNFGAPAYYTDFQQMLSAEKPDAVMVVGSPQMHEEIGIACFEAGCHVFTEKPSSPTTDGARRLARAGAKAGKLGQVGHMMRHADAVRLAWQISHSEEFGSILSVESKYCTWPFGTLEPGMGWGSPDVDWTYMLNQGGHPIDLMRHFIGPIVRVSGRRCRGAGESKVYQVLVEGRSGQVGFLNLQDSYDGWSTKLEVVGENQGYVTVEDLARTVYRSGRGAIRPEGDTHGYAARTWEPHFAENMGIRSGYLAQLRAFARAIIDGTQPFPSSEDGWRNLVVGECIIESCRSALPVEVPQEPL